MRTWSRLVGEAIAAYLALALPAAVLRAETSYLDGVLLSPLAERVVTLLGVLSVGTVLVVVWRGRGRALGGRVALAVAQLVAVGAAWVFVFSQGPWPPGVDPVRTATTQDGRIAYLYSNRSGCYEVYLGQRFSPRVYRVGRHHSEQSEPVITWSREGRVLVNGEEIADGGYCNHWL